MSDKPRYAPRSAYVTRRSGVEAQGDDPLCATALDRPVLDLDEVRRAHETRAKGSSMPETPAAHGELDMRLVALIVIAIALLAGATVGVIAALL